MKPLSQWSDSNKIKFCVIGPSMVAGPLALGAVLGLDKLAPRQKGALRDGIAKHIEPHIEWFDKVTKNLHKAHKEYDEKKAERRLEEGRPVHDAAPEDIHQRAKGIADTLLTFATALTADTAISYGLQRALNSHLKVCTHPGKTCFLEAAVQLGVTALMPTAFAGFSEDLHYGIAKTLKKTGIVDAKTANDIGVSGTYVILPGIAAASAALISAHRGSHAIA